MGNIETFALKQMYLYLSLAEIILEGVFLVKLTYFHHYLERIAGPWQKKCFFNEIHYSLVCRMSFMGL